MEGGDVGRFLLTLGCLLYIVRWAIHESGYTVGEWLALRVAGLLDWLLGPDEWNPRC